MRFDDRIVIVRQPAATTGHGGRQVHNWADAAHKPDVPADVQPISSTEDIADRQTTVTRWRLFLPHTEQLAAVDRVEWNGLTLEVDGEVELWRHRGADHHLEAILRRVAD